MSVSDKLLSKFDKVKKTGPGRWVVRCNSHDDGRPSLAITEKDDGRILLHCFAGCTTEEILGNAGLEFSDLYPEKPGEFKKERRPFNAHDILTCMATEAAFVASAASTLRNGKPLSQSDTDRLWTAYSRMDEARRLVSGE